jgi:hypothetical protein
MRPAVGFEHPEIHQHQSGCFRFHRSAAIGMQRQLIARHGMFSHRIDEQFLELAGAFGVLNAPADNAAAEDVEDDIAPRADAPPKSRHVPHR